mmetsp:Transcript_2070/g.2386  ORF Transcript_2070/g.2386 Transcript_2070/m.2386 type:complete len:88 (+) Transcript_2070:1-264(+)
MAEETSAKALDAEQQSTELLKDEEIDEILMAILGIVSLLLLVTMVIVCLEFLQVVSFGVGVRLGILQPRRSLFDVVWWLLSFVVRLH